MDGALEAIVASLMGLPRMVCICGRVQGGGWGLRGGRLYIHTYIYSIEHTHTRIYFV